jgi:hypothetical protein
MQIFSSHTYAGLFKTVSSVPQKPYQVTNQIHEQILPNTQNKYAISILNI